MQYEQLCQHIDWLTDEDHVPKLEGSVIETRSASYSYLHASMSKDVRYLHRVVVQEECS